MRVLVIGATGFIGPHVVTALARGGHDVIAFHRGNAAANAAREFHGDRRRLADYRAELRALEPDVVVDLILSSGRQAGELVDVFRGAARRVVAISSCDVYRACGVLHGSEPGPLQAVPLTEESELRTTLQTYPPDRIAMLQQVFGWLDDEYDKIPVEREILADAELPATVLRLPMVYGPGDRLHRFQPIVKRIADGRRTILFDEGFAAWRAPRGYVEIARRDASTTWAKRISRPSSNGRAVSRMRCSGRDDS
jgi:nucleoside-diphosphate-sugar epimerase